MKSVIAMFLIFCAPVLGQTTRPTTQPQSFLGTWQQMRDEITTLRAEIQKLKSENASLKAAIAPATASIPPATIERSVDEYEAAKDAFRTKEIARLKLEIRDMRESLKRMQRTPNSREYQEELALLTHGEKQLKGYEERALPDVLWMGKDLGVGKFGVIGEFKVVQIIDDRQALATIIVPDAGPETIWLRGVDFRGKVDGQALILDRQPFKVTGTKRYETTNGSRTIFMIEPMK